MYQLCTKILLPLIFLVVAPAATIFVAPRGLHDQAAVGRSSVDGVRFSGLGAGETSPVAVVEEGRGHLIDDASTAWADVAEYEEDDEREHAVNWGPFGLDEWCVITLRCRSSRPWFEPRSPKITPTLRFCRLLC